MEVVGCPLGIVGLPAHQRIAQSWNDYCCSCCFICTIIRERVLSGASSKWVAVLSGGKEGKRGTRQRWEKEIGRKWAHVFALTVQLVSGSSEGNCAPPSFILCILYHFFPLLFFLCVSSLVFHSACWYVAGRPDQPARQLDVSLACVGKPGLSDLMRGCMRFTILEKKKLFTCL